MTKWCFIGGGRGLIGSGIAEHFRGIGYEVVDADKTGEYACDLTDEKQVEKLFNKMPENMNEYVLINCQAIADPYTGAIEELADEKWQEFFNANIHSYFYACKHFAKKFKEIEGKKGSIINLSSTRHLMAEPDTEAYCATKGAIVSLSKALAVSLGPKGIRVNSISPGWIASSEEKLREKDHKQHPAQRVGSPLDIALACAYLADSKNGFLTGHDLVIDGGMTSKMIYEE